MPTTGGVLRQILKGKISELVGYWVTGITLLFITLEELFKKETNTVANLYTVPSFHEH